MPCCAQASNRDVYESVCRGLIGPALRQGISGTVFAYGVTSSGKVGSGGREGVPGELRGGEAAGEGGLSWQCCARASQALCLRTA